MITVRRTFKKLLKKSKKITYDYARLFLSSDEPDNSASDQLKESLINECESPEILLCSILQDMPNDLVVTPYGHLFSRQAITNWLATHHTCPLTRQPLQESDLLEHKKLTTMIEDVTHQFKDLKRAINAMSLSDEENIRQRIEVFNSFIALTNQDAAAELENV